MDTASETSKVGQEARRKDIEITMESKRNMGRIKEAFLSGDLPALIFLLFYFKSEPANFDVTEFTKNSFQIESHHYQK